MLATGRPFFSWSWVQQNWGQIVADLDQHIELTLIAVGIWSRHLGPLGRRRVALPEWRSPVTTATSVLYVIRRWPCS